MSEDSSAPGQHYIKELPVSAHDRDGVYLVWPITVGISHCPLLAFLDVPLTVPTTTTIIMSQFPIPPPSYGSTSPPPKSPYSAVSYHDEPGSSGIYNQPAPDDLPDDFKVGSLLSTRLIRPLTLRIVWCLCNGELC
jgi:hypothetical protein